jgi:hypothetical protein
MNNRRFTRVQIFQQRQQFVGPGQHLILWKRSLLLFEQFGEVVPGDVFHHQKFAVAFAEIVHDFWQRCMAQIGE